MTVFDIFDQMPPWLQELHLSRDLDLTMLHAESSEQQRCSSNCTDLHTFAPVICIQAPPPPPPTGIAGLMCRAITFQLSPQCLGIAGGLTLGSVEIFCLCRVGLRAGL